MNTPSKKIFYKLWRLLNGALALFFLYLIINSWVEALYFKNTEKQYYYTATLFFIPLLTCLIVVLGWELPER
jgi:hypothetical protein